MSAETDTLVADARALFASAVDAVRPSRLFASLDLNALLRDHASERIPGSLAQFDAVWIVAFGKAAIGMAGAAETAVSNGGGTVAGGVAVVPHGYADTKPHTERSPSSLRVISADHPVAGDASAIAGQEVLRVARNAGANDLLLTLISGGGTALTTLPVEDLDVWDVRYTYKLLLNSGADIHQMNAVRKHLTQLGGGQLAMATSAYVASLIISDVPGDDLSVIASGPTVPDRSTYEDAMRVLYQFGLWHDVPEPVREHLAAGARGRKPETPSDLSSRPGLQHLLATNQTAREAAETAGAEHGYAMMSPKDLSLKDVPVNQMRESGGPSHSVQGEAREVGAALAAAWLERAGRVDGPMGCVLGGETTVTVTGDGTGGRNQELALAAALEWEDTEADVVLLSAGTDGIDGPTDAAGAFATPETPPGCDLRP